MRKNILFVSHKKAQCGIYEFGKNVSEVLSQSTRYNFTRVECSSIEELHREIGANHPDAIIYNYHPSVLPWLTKKRGRIFHENKIASIPVPQIGIIHEVTQSVADEATGYRKKIFITRSNRLKNSLFDYYIAADPTLLLRNPLVYKTGRLVRKYNNNFLKPQKVTIGSFGFGTPGKGFEEIVDLVQKEFDNAVIRFNIPAADFGDRSGDNARDITDRCRKILTKQEIELEITHDFLGDKDILDFLASNTVNVFLYKSQGERGLSSTIDYAMAVRRPIAVSDSTMFRHLFDVEPSVRVSQNSLRGIIENGFLPLERHYQEWNSENLLWEYERIVDSVLSKWQERMGRKKKFISLVRTWLNRLLMRPDVSFTWLRKPEELTEDSVEMASVEYAPIQHSSGLPFNRILDNIARSQYEGAITTMALLVPNTMSKKIPEANVQQGFVFDTVLGFASRYVEPKILCVGSYEDTASMSLKRIGLDIEEIDPVINYSVEDFVEKPSTLKGSYDIIFSTSVIEHDAHDEDFIIAVSNLLAPGGVFIMTCDYKDGWKMGDPKPDVDARLYNQDDLRKRLLPLMENCEFVDTPQWDCPNPDFHFGKYNYTFATFVVKRKD